MSEPQTVREIATNCIERHYGRTLYDMESLNAEIRELQAATQSGIFSDVMGVLNALPEAFARLALIGMSAPGNRQAQARRIVGSTFRDLRALRTEYIKAAEAAEGRTEAVRLRAAPRIMDGAKHGYFEAKLADGSWGWLQRRPDDCLRAGVASLLQCSMHLLPTVYPGDLRSTGSAQDEVVESMDAAYQEWLTEQRVTLQIHADPPTFSDRWLAVVGEAEQAHCLIVRGSDVILDCGWVTPPDKDHGPRKLDDVAGELGGFTVGYTVYDG